ncbi:MAG: tRNA (guanosine(46)-N7)-methyltransferase TrmB [Clostridia bacterium]|nr:tRNA (guanosine(46)-N7)-methyltransferase TrmB [Clostridia bacterium]
MRPRNKKNLEKRLDACSKYIVNDPASRKGSWKSGFKAVRLEIGCGKGGFITGMAAANPEVLYVGIELVRSVIVTAAEKASAMDLGNVLFINANAMFISDYFEEGEIDELYLNFSDPWPRDRHHKNRLTSDTFMPLYIKVLKDRGRLIQKTDNRDLFDFSIEIYGAYGCGILRSSYDLHGEPWYGEISNVVTEYEERFTALNVPICYAEVMMPERSTAAEKIAECEKNIAIRREFAEKARRSGGN